jgi:predicted aspartyl protease/Flp pilus assembly protein TadD
VAGTKLAREILCVGLLWSGTAIGQSAPEAKTSAPAPLKKTCTVEKAPPNAAETALNRGDFKTAENLFSAMLVQNPEDEPAHEGLVRVLLADDRVADADKAAEEWITAAPAETLAITALADVRLRQGVPSEAYGLYRQAIHGDLCNARAYYGLARVEGLAGYFATGKGLIEQAYSLHPTDDDIGTAWISTRARKERLARWADYAEHSTQISDEERARLKTRLEKESLDHGSDCRIAPSSPKEATVPMQRILDGPTRFVGWGLDVQFNGRRRRLQIDTGASGITISRAAAMFLGIQREDATEMGGIGDQAKVKTSVAHVASIKIGGIEFTNCAVDILEKWSVLDDDGLIGGDVFSDSLLTLDFPKHELRVAPLPPRPGDKASVEGSDDVVEAHDPYVAPGMEKWLRVYRSGHDLLMPTGLVDTKKIKDAGAWKTKLFLMDTGSEDNLISPAAARDVTKISRDDSRGIRGIQGEVDKVYEAGKFTLAFAGLRLDSPSMTSIDTTSISRGAGVEVSGIIGAAALFQVVMHIDYRDNLVMCEYTPVQ